eukprot:7077715-Pyramimonas_sp.AAC.1
MPTNACFWRAYTTHDKKSLQAKYPGSTHGTSYSRFRQARHGNRLPDPLAHTSAATLFTVCPHRAPHAVCASPTLAVPDKSCIVSEGAVG